MQRSRACKVLPMERQLSRPADRGRSALKESAAMHRCMERSTRMTAADIAMANQYALRFHLIDHIAIRKWGDDLVTSLDSPAIWAIDLADCHAHDVEERLRRVPGTPNGTAWQKLLCGLISIRWQQHQLTIGTMRGIGWTLYIEDNYQDTSHWGLELECIGEGYDDGYGTLESLTNAADSTARSFEQYENLVPAWMAAIRAEQLREPEPPSGSN